MAVRGVARDEHATHLVAVGDGHAQVPEPHVVELRFEGHARRLLQQSLEVVVLRRRVFRHRRVEEPAHPHLHAAEEHPVAVQLRVHRAEGGGLREAFEVLVQVRRPEHGQAHLLVEVGPVAADAHLAPDHRPRAVAADDVVGLQDASGARDGLPARVIDVDEALPRVPPALLCRVLRLLDGDAHAALVLLDVLRRPPVEQGDVGEVGGALAQHLFGQVLGQALVGDVVVAAQLLAARRRPPVLAVQVLVGGDPADGVSLRHDARRPQLVLDAPEVEVLQGALREVLPLGNALGQQVAANDDDVHPAHAEVQPHRDANRPAADHDDLVPFRHDGPPDSRFPRRGECIAAWGHRQGGAASTVGAGRDPLVPLITRFRSS